MFILKYNKSLNSFSLNKADELCKKFSEIHKKNIEELPCIDDIKKIIARNYSCLFYKTHKEKNHLLYNPHLALDFNFAFEALFLCILIDCFYNCKMPIEKKLNIFRKTTNALRNEWIEKQNSKKEEFEAISELEDFIKAKLYEAIGRKYKSPISIKIRKYFLFKMKFGNIYKNLDLMGQKLFACNEVFFAVCLFITVSIFCIAINLYSAYIRPTTNFELYTMVLINCILCTILIYDLISNIKLRKTIKILKDFNDFSGLYNKLGVDTLSIRVSKKLKKYIKPKEDDCFAYAISNFRLNLIDKIGYALPSIKIFLDEDLKEGISILLRGIDIVKFDFYFDKIAIFEKIAKENNIEIDKNAIKTQYEDEIFFWVNKKTLKETDEKLYFEPTEILEYILNDIVFKNIENIFSLKDTQALCELAFYFQTKKIYKSEKLNLFGLKNLFIKIIQNGGSLKDICFVLDKIESLSDENLNIDYIANKICEEERKLNEKEIEIDK